MEYKCNIKFKNRTTNNKVTKKKPKRAKFALPTKKKRQMTHVCTMYVC